MDAAIREDLLGQIRGVVGDRFAFADPYEMRLYQYDASPETALPDIVVIPGTAKEVAKVVKICADGELVQVGGRNAAEAIGYDLTGVLVGSEGTMGVVTQIWVKIQPLPPVQKTLMAVYPDVATASNAVSAIVRTGILPAAIEMMD